MALAELVPGSRLPEIAGTVPSLLDMPSGCAFAPRCAQVRDACLDARPALDAVGQGGAHSVACFLPLANIGAPHELLREVA